MGEDENKDDLDLGDILGDLFPKLGEKRKGRDFSECDAIKTDFGGENRWSSLEDLMDDLTCVDPDKSDDDVKNPCEDLKWADCKAQEGCEMQNRVCVWTQAPADERNLYVVYDWKYLTVDGDVQDETFCYDDGSAMIESLEDFEQVCEAIVSQQGCGDMGCKWKSLRKDSNAGRCVANKRVRCKKLTKINCGRFENCNWKEQKEKCTGKQAF